MITDGGIIVIIYGMNGPSTLRVHIMVTQTIGITDISVKVAIGFVLPIILINAVRNLYFNPSSSRVWNMYISRRKSQTSGGKGMVAIL